MLINVLLKELYGPIQAKSAYQIVLNKKNIHMIVRNVKIDVIQVKYGKELETTKIRVKILPLFHLKYLEMTVF